jgi:hypothetical protein
MNCPQCELQLVVVDQFCPNCDQQLLFITDEKGAQKSTKTGSIFSVLKLVFIAVIVFIAVSVGGWKLMDSGLLKNKTNMEICGGFNRCYRELYAKELNESKSFKAGTTITAEGEGATTMRAHTNGPHTDLLVKETKESLTNLARMGYFKRVIIEGDDGKSVEYAINWPVGKEPK